MLTLPEVLPFLCTFAVLLLFGAIELVAVFSGMEPSRWVDGWLDGIPSDGFLGWLHIGRAPFLVLLTVFLTTFSVLGILLNAITFQVIAHALPVWISIPIATLASLPAVRAAGYVTVRLIPQEESYGANTEVLIGRMATMLGNASTDLAAEARVKDGFSRTLYLMVAPEAPATELAMGSQVLLIRKLNGKFFTAIPNPRPDLLE